MSLERLGLYEFDENCLLRFFKKVIMLRQTSSRNQRSKGFKKRHALQIFLLLVVSGWLIYQVKHSRDKKKAFDEKNVKMSTSVAGRHEILKFGRKDLNHRIEMVSEREKYGKEEEEGEESKEEEGEDEDRGDGDDEIDENDQDIAEEDCMDEEEDDTEKEENEEDVNIEKEDNEAKNEDNEDMDASEDQDDARTVMDSQDAHEKQYHGDDASSAVVSNTQTIRKVEIGGLEKSLDEHMSNSENNDLEDEKTNRTEYRNFEHNNTILKSTIVLGDNERIDVPSTNEASDQKKDAELSLFTSENKFPLDLTKESNNQATLYGNSTVDNVEAPGPSLWNVSIVLNSTREENKAVNSSSKTTVMEQTEKSISK